MKSRTNAAQSRESGFAKLMTYLILLFVVVVVVPLYVYREVMLLRALANDPVSPVIPFGKPLDPLELARRLNPEGAPINVRDVIEATNGRCGDVEGTAIPKGQITAVTFHVEGTERHSVVYVPNSYPSAAATTTNATSVPMLVLFHGLNDNCEHFLNATSFLPYSEQHSFVVVSACGSLGYLGTAWNAGTCCGFSGNKPNDVGFARQIVKDMSQVVCVNERKVMAVGFSNGAMLAEVLACEAPDVFQAAVSIGGVVEMRPGNAEGLALCTEKVRAQQHRASVLMVHGTADVMVPWGGSRLLGFPAIEANVAGWIDRNDCEANITNSTIHTKTYANTIYTQCGDIQTNAAANYAEAKERVRHTRQANVRDGHIAQVAMETQVPGVPLPPPRPAVESLGHRKKHRGNGEVPIEEKNREEHEEKDEGHHHPRHPHRKKEHKKEGKPRPYIAGPCPTPPTKNLQANVYADSATSQIELVKVEGGAHSWPEDKEFSTTNYIIQFGARAFGGYNA